MPSVAVNTIGFGGVGGARICGTLRPKVKNERPLAFGLGMVDAVLAPSRGPPLVPAWMLPSELREPALSRARPMLRLTRAGAGGPRFSRAAKTLRLDPTYRVL